MEIEFKKMKVKSLKEHFVNEMESQIISGRLSPGDRLPSERELSKQVGISRSVVNMGILELATKGFVKVIPRKGTFIADYMKESSIAILSAVLHHLDEDMDKKLFIDTNHTRSALEVESAREAAINRSGEDVEALEIFIKTMEQSKDIETLISTNIDFHNRVTSASKNMVSYILLKSFEDVIRQVLKYFYNIPGAMECSFKSHKVLFEEIKQKDRMKSGEAMKKIFVESEKIFLDYNKNNTDFKK